MVYKFDSIYSGENAQVQAGLDTCASPLQDKCHPQTIAVCQSRADGLGLKVLVSSEEDFQFDRDVSGILLQYPATDGAVHDYKVSVFIQIQLLSVRMLEYPTKGTPSIERILSANRFSSRKLVREAPLPSRRSAFGLGSYSAAWSVRLINDYV